jgi:hypothetical protein
MDDVPAVTPEPGAVPFEEYVPFVCVSVGMNQEIALRANRTPISGLARTSFEVEQTARAIVEGVEGDRAKAEAVFRWVTKNVRGGDLVDPAIALATRRGDRTGLITALLRAAGLQAEIVLARPNGAPRLDPPYLEPQRFGTALIRVRLEGAFSWISADDRAPWMGKAPPEFRGGSYVLARGEPATPIAFQNADVERWTLKSRVVLQVDASGNASGHVKIDLPGAPGQVIREALGPLRREDLARSLQQWVAAFLPGSAVGEVEVTARDDALVPLGISVKVTVPEFMTEERGKLVTNRFFDEPIATRAVGAPMLEAFIHLATRETPLWVPEMSESMEARVTFPEGTAPPIEKPESFSRGSEWGTVEQTFAWDAAAHRATLVRSFAFPAQRVSVEKFPAFRDLVQEIALRTRNRLAIPRAVLAHSP